MKNELEKKTKSSFIAHALNHGLSLIAAPWNIPLADITDSIDRSGARVISALEGKRDRVVAKGQTLERNGSRLQLGKEDTIYKYGEFWLARGEYPNGVNNTVIYA